MIKEERVDIEQAMMIMMIIWERKEKGVINKMEDITQQMEIIMKMMVSKWRYYNNHKCPRRINGDSRRNSMQMINLKRWVNSSTNQRRDRELSHHSI